MLIKFLSNDRYFKYIKPTLYSIRIPLRRVLFFFSDCERSSLLFMIIHRLKTIYLEDTSCKHCVRRINLENS